MFDLGTNDDPANPDALAADLRAARQIAGDRCLVVATLNRPPLNGVPVDGLNRAVTTFASERPKRPARRLARAPRSAIPALLVDGVHTDASGYALRAKLFAQAVDACGGVGGLSASGGPATSGPLEHESSDDLPPASAGRQTHAEPKPPPDPGPSQRQQRLHDLAVAVGRAVGTGAEFG